MVPTNTNPCVYQVERGEDLFLIAIFIDDILVLLRDCAKIPKLRNNVSQEFEIKGLAESKYCLGIEFISGGHPPRGERKVVKIETGFGYRRKETSLL